MKTITLNTKQTFANFDEELEASLKFTKEHPFGKKIRELIDSLKNDLYRYDIGGGCTTNELEELCGVAYDYGFNLSETGIGSLIKDLRLFISNEDFVVFDKNGIAVPEQSNKQDTANLFNELVDIATKK